MAREAGYLNDGANRLRQGDYVARAGGAGSTVGRRSPELQHYALRGVSYDVNGNLLAMQRRCLWRHATSALPAQFGPVDHLTHAYDGNRLCSVLDAVSTNQLPCPTGYHRNPPPRWPATSRKPACTWARSTSTITMEV